MCIRDRGQTRDDAVGEAFDKVSKMLGLGFPGGAIIARLAEEYRESGASLWTKRVFPLVMLEWDSLDFSFSGLKSAVKRLIDDEILQSGSIGKDFQSYIAYEFEETVTDILAQKLQRAFEMLSLIHISSSISRQNIISSWRMIRISPI